MYKNQLQELAQRSCFNLPSYSSVREGPDHAPRFKASVNFNGEIFESPNHCPTLRLAEHSAAEVALNSLANRGPSHSLAARILDETGVYKNLLQEIAQRVGAPLPQYTTVRSGLGHLPVFTGSIELAGITFTGEPAKNKKQAEKNAALAAWSSLKQLAKEAASSSEVESSDEPEQVMIARALLNYRLKEKMFKTNPNVPMPFPKKLSFQSPRATSPQPPPATTSKILPFICKKPISRSRLPPTEYNSPTLPSHPLTAYGSHPQKFPAPGAVPYVPIRQYRMPCRGIVPPVTIRTAVPVYAAPPFTQPPNAHSQVRTSQHIRIAPPVSVRQAIPVFAAPPPLSRKEFSALHKGDSLTVHKQDPSTTTVEGSANTSKADHSAASGPVLLTTTSNQVPETQSPNATSLDETKTVQHLKQLKIQ
ncbi:Double-stranded RNA-binding protein 2 [Cucurbita argyrosperma subsp. argyrosperma]|nr:Double-stranded RNA-binding protein 2 [Cucurbita argyrosperma subsp. argyrosperma]